FLIAKIELKEGNSRLTSTNSQSASKNETASSNSGGGTASKHNAVGPNRASVSK
ncbi:hypothetical protein HDV05_008522, partial [Chytridiales sp. JEL 0842]